MIDLKFHMELLQGRPAAYPVWVEASNPKAALDQNMQARLHRPG